MSQVTTKSKPGFWTKPRPSVFVLLLIMALLNFFYGPKLYYDLGLKYKDRGWTEASRIMLQFSHWANPWDPVGWEAEKYMKARLPRNQIPEAAQAKNIDGYNLDAFGRKAESIKVFEELIRDYPNFEWPYNNLACTRLEQGELEEAKRLCEQALKINPDYANAHLTLAETLQKMGRHQQALPHILAAKELVQDGRISSMEQQARSQGAR